MVKEENKFGYGIKGKLTSAVAMLLVAVIMVVSSTYAWFTLSTAPEVTGITTAVGANGALEMLLATWDADKNDWIYNSGQIASGADENTYWGNLINLSDNQKYGSDKIVLYPSKLNVSEEGILGAAPLLTPEYMPDGRVHGVNDNTAYGKFDGTNFMEDEDYYGFRAVGVASGMTPRQLEYRNARAMISTLMARARNAASTSLTQRGTTLANIAVKKALSGDSAIYTPAEIATIGTMITELEATLEHIEDAYFQAFLTVAASNLTGEDDVAYNAMKAEIESAADINALVTALADYSSYIPAEITNGIANYNQALDAVAEAKAKYEAIATKDTYVWNDFSAALTPLVNIDAITINGKTATEIKENMSAFVNEALKGILVTMPTGGGVYADIADQAGDYKVDIKVDLSEAAGFEVEMDAKMETKTTLADEYLDAIYVLLDNKKPASGDADMPLTEFYGYVIDLAFRTNAAQSNLLLQQKGVDRIYGDNNNVETMGAGSSMTFKTDDTSFTTKALKDLMGNLRIVFFDTKGLNIYAYAKLDMTEANVTTTADGTTAYMYLYKIVNNAYEAADGTIVFAKEEEGKTNYYTDVKCTTLYTGDVETTAPVHKPGYEVKLDGKDAIITDLVQNTAKHVSALVYLDGETIENGDVAASAAQSMYGKMNLQFASDANLVPMEYGNLHQTGTATEEADVTASATDATEYTPNAVSGATWAFKETAPSGWTIDAASGKVTIPAGATATDVVITATVDEKVVKEITLKVTAGT